jgi:DNA integrity scanning protein DisA with diadenylate cyclase activity
MGRRDRVSITEGYYLFILIENISLYLTSYDSTKNAISLVHISPTRGVDAENVTIVLGYRQATSLEDRGYRSLKKMFTDCVIMTKIDFYEVLR